MEWIASSVLEIAEKEACMNGSRLDISPGEQMLSRVSTYVRGHAAG